MNELIKICSLCKLRKSVSEFNFRLKKTNTYQSMCKVCKKDYDKVHSNDRRIGHKLWKKNNPEKVRNSKFKYLYRDYIRGIQS